MTLSSYAESFMFNIDPLNIIQIYDQGKLKNKLQTYIKYYIIDYNIYIILYY